MGTQARAEVSLVREATAARRDIEADARDAAAAARDKLAAALDAEIERLENSPITRGENESAGVVLLIHSLHNRRRAASSRARAAEQREAAARDREMARLDRIAASADLRAAAEELAAEGVDHLTRALRRRVGLLALQREIDRTTRGREQLVVAFVDVDGLKKINDTQGHDAGDRVLAGVAESIAGQLRSYDVIMRFGGDEFVCSMAGQGLDAVRERFDEIATTMAADARRGVGDGRARPVRGRRVARRSHRPSRPRDAGRARRALARKAPSARLTPALPRRPPSRRAGGSATRSRRTPPRANSGRAGSRRRRSSCCASFGRSSV